MDFIINQLKGIIEGILWGIVFLFLAVLLLPDGVFAKILKRIKPDFTSRSLLFTRIKTVLDYLLNKKGVVIEDSTSIDIKAKQKEISDLIKEKTILENNLFFLDLLKNLAAMTHFSVVHAGYGEEAVCSILEQSMEYIQYYTKGIKDSKSFVNQQEHIFLSAENLQQQVSDVAKFFRTHKKEEELKVDQIMLKQVTERFDSSMRAEYDSTCEQLSRINQLLADRFMEYIGHGI